MRNATDSIRRADEERHFACATQRLDWLQAAHAAPEGHQGQTGGKQPAGNQQQPFLITETPVREAHRQNIEPNRRKKVQHQKRVA